MADARDRDRVSRQTHWDELRKMSTIRLLALLAVTATMAACDGRSSSLYNRLDATHLTAALGADEITEFGAHGSRMAWYDVMATEPRRLHIQGHQLLREGTCNLHLHIREPQEGRTYALGRPGSEAYAIFTSSSFPENLLRSFSTAQDSAGSLVLTRFDQRSQIAEGTFQFVARNNTHFSKDPTTPDSIRVTNGRFRLDFLVVDGSAARGSD